MERFKSATALDLLQGILSILAPLTKLAVETRKLKGLTRKKLPWKWEQEHQDVFDKAKKMIKSKAELAFPDWAKPVDLYPNANEVQLGATLVQNRKPLGFYTRKLNVAQTRISK